MARELIRPSFAAAWTTQRYSHFGGNPLDLAGLVKTLDEQIKAVNEGDLSGPERMLVAHAQTLDAVFHSLARRAELNLNENPAMAETYLRLAFKAQSQCRSTIEALAEIRSPRAVALVRQANIANGPQQVTNGHPAREIENEQTFGGTGWQPAGHRDGEHDRQR